MFKLKEPGLLYRGPVPLQGSRGVSFTLAVHFQNEVNAIKWDPTGNLLASCSDDMTLKVNAQCEVGWLSVVWLHCVFSAMFVISRNQYITCNQEEMMKCLAGCNLEYKPPVLMMILLMFFSDIKLSVM